LTDRLRLALWSGLVGFLVLVAYAGRVSEGQPDRDVLYKYSTAIGSGVVYAVILVIVLALAGFRRDLLGLVRPRSWPAALGLALAILVGTYIALAFLEPVLHGGREQGLTPPGWEPSHAGAFAANFAVVAAMAPLTEELTFRGLGFSLLERHGRWLAIVVVGVAFGLAHGLVQALPELALFGCALAWLRARTGSVLPGMLLHAVFNALALIAAVTIDN
jgi:membrane protease YdiL (CAAX protease family)